MHTQRARKLNSHLALEHRYIKKLRISPVRFVVSFIAAIGTCRSSIYASVLPVSMAYHRTVQFTLSLGERMSHGKHLQCRRNKNINLTLHTYTTGSESSSSHTSSTWRTLARVRDAKIQLKGTWCSSSKR